MSQEPSCTLSTGETLMSVLRSNLDTTRLTLIPFQCGKITRKFPPGLLLKKHHVLKKNSIDFQLRSCNASEIKNLCRLILVILLLDCCLKYRGIVLMNLIHTKNVFATQLRKVEQKNFMTLPGKTQSKTKAWLYCFWVIFCVRRFQPLACY